MKKQTELLFILFFLFINIFLIIFFSSDNFLVNIYLFIDFIIIFAILIYHIIFQQTNLIFSSFLLFNYLFFFMAPLLQIHSISPNGFFPNTLPFDESLILLGFFSIIIFNIIFFISYIVLNKSTNHKQIMILNYNNIIFYILVFISIAVLYFFQDKYIEFMMKEAFQGETSKGILLIINKVLFTLIFAPTIYFTLKFKQHKNIKYFFLFIISLILLMIFKNPLIEKRNALGPIYLTLLFFLTPGLFKTNTRSILFLMVSMIIVFPAITIFTHRRDNTHLLHHFNSNVITDAFSTLHYDAFSNILASLHYMINHGISFGYQLFGGLFFFIPRSFWTDKPLSGGKEIGNYLISNFQMWFDNLSMPFIGESIMNFGYFGLLIYPVILAFIVSFFEKWLNSGDFLKKTLAVYFSFHFIFFLRGDFTNGFAYFMGTFIAIYLIPKLLILFFTQKKGKKCTSCL